MTLLIPSISSQLSFTSKSNTKDDFIIGATEKIPAVGGPIVVKR